MSESENNSSFPPAPPTTGKFVLSNDDKELLLAGLNERNNRLARLAKIKNEQLQNKQLPINGGSKRNKKSVRRLVKKRNTKRRKSRRVKH